MRTIPAETGNGTQYGVLSIVIRVKVGAPT